MGRPIADEDELKKMIEGQELQRNEARKEDMKKMAVRLRLITRNEVPLPETFLLKWVNEQRKEAIEAGSRQADDFFRDVRWSFLLNRIAKDQGLEVTDKDIQDQVYRWIMENVNYQQTDLKKVLKQLYSNEYFMSTMRDNALEDVVFRDILPRYTFVENPVPGKEFEDTFHKMYHQVFGMGDHHHPEYEHSVEGHEHSHAESH